MLRNITDRNRAEDALKNSEKRLSDIIDFLPDAMFAIDTGSRVIAWNKAIARMTGILLKICSGKATMNTASPFMENGDRFSLTLSRLRIRNLKKSMT